MFSFIVGLILGGIIGFVGCSVLVIAGNDAKRRKSGVTITTNNK